MKSAAEEMNKKMTNYIIRLLCALIAAVAIFTIIIVGNNSETQSVIDNNITKLKNSRMFLLPAHSLSSKKQAIQQPKEKSILQKSTSIKFLKAVFLLEIRSLKVHTNISFSIKMLLYSREV